MTTKDEMPNRRGFLTRLFGTAAGVTFVAGRQAGAQTATTAASGPDAWIKEVKGTHRCLFDFPQHKNGAPLLHILNYLNTYNEAYKSAPGTVGAVGTFYSIGTQSSIALGFNDAMWAKYGKSFSERIDFLDPKTNKVPTTNVYAAQLGGLLKQGVHLAVCNLSTRSTAQRLAELNGVSAEETYKELTTNALPNAHFVAAGVIGATRAQEHGYALISIG